MERVELVAAGGRVKGNLWLDGSRRPAEAMLDLRVRGMHLDSLSSAMPETRRVTGELDARVTIRSQGESLTALLNGATGSLRAALRGATISDRFDAELGLNGGRLLRALFTGTQRVPVQCAILAIDFLEGTGKIRRLAVETERTALDGRGSVSLVRESFDAILVPASKQRSFLALNKAIHLSGSFRSAKVELISSVERLAPNGCERGEFSRVRLLTPVQLRERRQ